MAIPKSTSQRADGEYSFYKSAIPADFEDVLSVVKSPKIIGLPSEFNKHILSSAWCALSIGSICKKNPETAIKTLGLSAYNSSDKFHHTIYGAAIAQFCRKIHLESGVEIRIDEPPLTKDGQFTGLVDDLSGSERLILEYDPQYSNAKAFQIPNRSDFDQLRDYNIACNEAVENLIRKQIQALMLEKGQKFANRYDVDAPINRLLSFVLELQDNSYRYARTGSLVDLGFRCIRFAKHVHKDKSYFHDRCSGFPKLYEYVNSVCSNDGFNGLMEINITDFGEGIVNHFLASERGYKYRNFDRPRLIEKLMYEDLGSSRSSSSGKGIQRALEAVRKMSGFVSLRTDEFWMTQDFSASEQSPILQDCSEKAGSKVAGTHWQLLVPRPKTHGAS